MKPTPLEVAYGGRDVFFKGSVLRRWGRAVLRFCYQKPLGAFGAVVIIGLLILAMFPDAIAPYRYDEINFTAMRQGPSREFFFGTDAQGRDIFSRVVYGARTSIFTGFGAVALATVLSTAIGMVSGYVGGLPDLFFQRLIDIWQSFPGLIFVIFLVSVFTPGEGTIIVAIALLFTAGSSRVVRGAVIAAKQNTYIEAAHALGAGSGRILLLHLLPNVLSVVIINASVQVGAVILIEASLAFLGLGVPPPFPSWGRMLQEGQLHMRAHPHMVIFPGVAIALTVYAFNMLGDALRDVLDPRMRGSR